MRRYQEPPNVLSLTRSMPRLYIQPVSAHDPQLKKLREELHFARRASDVRLGVLVKSEYIIT
jgi:hypothetical protein